MSHQKDRHYWTQLRSSLTAGQWSSQYPAKTPNGISLSWSELLRKFNKHCKGFNDVAEVASQTQALALLLAANSKDEDQDDATSATIYPLDLGNECMLPEERIEEASVGYETLKKLESPNYDTLNFALAYYAYALGNPSQCLSHLNKVQDLLHLRNHIPSQGSGSSMTTLQVPGSSAAPSFSSAGGSFASLVDTSTPEIRDGRGWAMTETFRSLCLQGMSHEKLSPSEPEKALRFYGAAIPLLSSVVSELAPNCVPTTLGKVELASFTQYRELWRWAERLIWRAVVLSARTSNVHNDASEADPASIWTWLGHHRACSFYWPAYFRTIHRSTVSVMYLRAAILRHGHKPRTSLPVPDSEKSPSWLHNAKTVVNDYRAILGVSTTFPRAGERNIKVEDFVDLCVGVWEASGAVGDHAGWVLNVLWWATRLTFNSYRILRHMTWLLYASSDTALAKRTLHLYVQVVGKAWQANNGSLGDGTDTNEYWVKTLVSGARMLCKAASVLHGLDGIEDVREAGVYIEKARTRLDTDDLQLTSSVDFAEGVWNSVMALKEQDPHTRPRRLADAHALFLRSVESYPSPSAYFHLALSFARPGPSQDLEQAIDNASLAVEGDPTEIRHWHLLGLLLAATEKWEAAGEILERGAGLGESDNEDDVNSINDDQQNLDSDDRTLRVPVSISTNGGDVQSRDFGGSLVNGNATARSTTSSVNGSSTNGTPDRAKSVHEPSDLKAYVLEKDAGQIPASSTLLNPSSDCVVPSRQDFYEYALQLRMSQAALTEIMEGAEGAELKWVEIFSWIANKKGTPSGPTPRPSMDGGRPFLEKSPSFILSAPSEKPTHNTQTTNLDSVTEKEIQNELQLQAIPITISPATPEVEVSQPRMSSSSSEKKGHDRPRSKRSSSIDRDTSKSKKVQQMLKNRVHKSQARITTISRKIGNGVVRNGSLKRSNSTPDFHAVLRQTSYQASSIHSRRRLSSIIHHSHDRTPNDSPPPPPIPPPQETKRNSRIARSNRLLADLWLMSAATFRRLGKIEQAKGAIQEAEVRDESNPAVWVQLGLYHMALGQRPHAIDAFQKALFISPDDVPAAVHLARIYLSLEDLDRPPTDGERCSASIDLATGMLAHLTRGAAWDVPEAWYYLAKAYDMQGRKDRARECLNFALSLSETRGIRDIGIAVGWCI